MCVAVESFGAGRKPRVVIQSGQQRQGQAGLEVWAHHWENSRADAVGGRHTDWGPGLDDTRALLQELKKRGAHRWGSCKRWGRGAAES